MSHGGISLNSVLLLLLGNFVSGLRFEFNVYIPHCKHQVKLHSSPWFSAASAAAIVHRNHFFHLYPQNKSSESKLKFRQASNGCKRVLAAAKLANGNKTKESITFQKLGSRYFWRIANSALNKGKSAIPPLFNGPEVLSSASDKAKLFAENFSKNSNVDDSGNSQKIITNLDLSKVSGPDCIPVVVLKNCEPELSYILAKLFSKYLKESCFPDCWKVSSVVLVVKNVGERSTAKNYCPVSLLSVVSKVFEKLVNNRIVDHLEKYVLFSDFQYGFSSRSTADLVTVVSERIARAFNRSGATRTVALDITKAFDKVWHAGLFTSLSFMEFQVRYLVLFLLFSVIDGLEWFWKGSLQKNIQLMLEFLKAPFLVLHFSYDTLMKKVIKLC